MTFRFAPYSIRFNDRINGYIFIRGYRIHQQGR